MNENLRLALALTVSKDSLRNHEYCQHKIQRLQEENRQLLQELKVMGSSEAPANIGFALQWKMLFTNAMKLRNQPNAENTSTKDALQGSVARQDSETMHQRWKACWELYPFTHSFHF